MGFLRVLRLLPPLKSGHHEIAEMLLKVTANTINQINQINLFVSCRMKVLLTRINHESISLTNHLGKNSILVCIYGKTKFSLLQKKMDMTDCVENCCRAITPQNTTPNKRLLIVMWKQCYTTDNVLIISKDMLLYFYVFISML